MYQSMYESAYESIGRIAQLILTTYSGDVEDRLRLIDVKSYGQIGRRRQ
jgi:hypothetical protein